MNVGFEVFEIVIRKNDETYWNQNKAAQNETTSLKSPRIEYRNKESRNIKT